MEDRLDFCQNKEDVIFPLPFGFYASEDYFGDFWIYHWDGHQVETLCQFDYEWGPSCYVNLDQLLDEHLKFNLECWYLGE